MRISLLLLIICLLCGIVVMAQTGNTSTKERVYYYYQGKKMYMPVSYEQIIVGVKTEFATADAERKIATIASVDAILVKASSAKNQFIIKFKKGEAESFTKAAVGKLLQSANVLYARANMVSTAGKFVSYGNEFVVKLKQTTTITAMQNLINKNQCTLVREYPFVNTIFIISAGQSINYDGLKMANVFYESGLFEYAEPDMTLHNAIDAVPDDPLYNLQWAHNNTGSAAQFSGMVGADMSVQAAWDITMGSNSIKIAVLDNGVQLTHPDLQANILQGFDCTTLTSNATDGSPKATTLSHGTNCAGVIAAVANNNIGVTGVAPNCKIIPINLSAASGTFTSDANIAAGFDYARLNGADVISNSWGGGGVSSVLNDAITRATTLGRGGKGCVVLFSSGNNNAGIGYPAVNDNVIAVGGINMCNQRKSPTSCDGETWGASYGTGLDLVAPCVKIATTDLTGTGGANTAAGTAGDYHNTFNGTSSACPNAAGVAALVLSLNNNYTLYQVRQILEGSCTKIPAYNYSMTINQPNGTWNAETGHGRINALAALQLAQSGVFCSVQIQAAGATRFCSSGSVVLSVINPILGTSYQWKKDGSNISIGTSITATLSGDYTVEATNSNTCIANSSAITVTQLTNSSTLAANAGVDTSICIGNSVTLGSMQTAAGGTPFLNEKRAYAMEWYSNTFIRFNLTEPEKFDTIAKNVVSASDFTNGYFFAGGCFTPYGYYGITRITNKLIKIDTVTGVQTIIGFVSPPSGYAWSGLAWDPIAKSLYALAAAASSSYLYKLNPLTAAAISSVFISSRQLLWIAINNNGSMYGLDINNDIVYKVNKETGTTTASPSGIGFNARFAQDGAFDPVNDKLYMSAFQQVQNYVGDLRTVDTLTGLATLVGTLGGSSEVDALAIAGSTYTYSWQPTTGLSNANAASPIATPAATTEYILTVTDACGNIAKDTVVVKVNVPGTWLGANTNWLSPLNWCGSIPTASTDVIIPAGLANYPNFGLNSFLSCNNIRIDSGASFVLGSGARLLIKGTLINNGTVTGTGDFIMNGTTQQTIQGNGTISNMQINNLTGAIIASGNNKLNITGTLVIYGGIVLNTNDNLVLKSSATSTGKIYGFAAPYLNGKTTVERYIPGRRAYRFMAHPFNDGMPLTQITDDVDITGNNADIVGGFTASGTGAASSFWYNPIAGNGSTIADPGWTAFTTASQTVGVGDGYRLFVRGAKGNLSPAIPAPITLSTIGTLNMGNFTKNLTLGSQSGYNVIGNPFPCPINLINLTKTTSINSNFWVWNPYVGTAGGYLTYTFGVDNFALPTSASFFVQATATAQSFTFQEGDKVLVDTATVLRTLPVKDIVEIEVVNNNQLWDRFVLRFNSKASSNKDVLLDADKFMNGSASLYSFSKDEKPLAIDVRPFEDAIIPMGFTSSAARTYTFNVKNCNIENEIYLRDNYLNTDTKLREGIQYVFSTDANAASQGEQRFELVTKVYKPLVAVTISQQFGVNVYPNPSTDKITISYQGLDDTEATSIYIADMNGKRVKSIEVGKISSGNKTINIKGFSNGAYTLQLINGSNKQVQSIIKK